MTAYETLHRETDAGSLRGTYHPDFADVAARFEANFTEQGEVGAAVCITRDQETVVDLWGGTRTVDGSDAPVPWEEDTVCVVFSTTKGMVALAAHLLIDAGELDLHAPVQRYWPEFARDGKEDVTVKMMLDHTAGVPAFRDKLPDGAFADWAYMISRLEAEAPFWRPGTRNGYHMMSFGWTVGELVRRAAGQSLGTFFRQALAEPTGADCWIGLPEAEEGRVARMLPYRPPKGAPQGAFTRALIEYPQSLPALALFNQGGFNPNSRACRAAEIGGGGGVANARGLARLYAPFAGDGSLEGRRYVSTDTLTAMSEVAVATHEDATLLLPSRFGLGFMKSMDNRHELAVTRDSVILGASAFGHVGAGGSIGFADPSAGMSFGYVMNRMGPGILMNERGQGLVDAAYHALGYAGNQAGVWRK